MEYFSKAFNRTKSNFFASMVIMFDGDNYINAKCLLLMKGISDHVEFCSIFSYRQKIGCTKFQ